MTAKKYPVVKGENEEWGKAQMDVAVFSGIISCLWWRGGKSSERRKEGVGGRENMV